jgi:site-specific recombinase XerD
MLLSSAIEAFISSVCAGKRNETPKAYKTKLTRLVAFLGDVDIKTVTAADLENFRQAMLTQEFKRRGSVMVREPLSVWYIRGVLRSVVFFFRWCADDGRIKVNPALRLKIPKAPQVLPKAISQETFDKLLDAAAASGEVWARARNVAFLCLLRDTGGRVSGLLSAMVGDVDLDGGTITVTEKGKARAVFFNRVSRAALLRWLDIRKTLELQSDALFVGREGRVLTRKGVYSLLNRLADVAGLDGQRHNPHAFRHAFARDSLRAGADLSEVSQMMGHSTIKVTGDYYARWAPSELKEVHKRTSPGVTMRDVLGDGVGGDYANDDRSGLQVA